MEGKGLNIQRREGTVKREECERGAAEAGNNEVNSRGEKHCDWEAEVFC